MNTLTLFVNISNECQKKCDHCYSSNSGGKMDRKVVEEVVGWSSGIFKEEKSKKLKLVLLGGEPLTNMDNCLGMSLRLYLLFLMLNIHWQLMEI